MRLTLLFGLLLVLEGKVIFPKRHTRAPTASAPVAKSSVSDAIPTPSVKAVVGTLFWAMGITNVDANVCVSNVGGAGQDLRDFAYDLNHDGKAAVSVLARAVSSLASSVSSCNVPEVETKLDTLAAALHVVNVTGLDRTLRVFVGAAAVEKDIEALATTIRSDPYNIGNALQKLMDSWSAIAGNCDTGRTTCKLLDGILRIVQLVSTNTRDLQACEQALQPAFTDLESGIKAFSAYYNASAYATAVQTTAKGLDEFGTTLQSGACSSSLNNLGALLTKLSPKLAQAVASSEKIAVGYADVYDNFYQASMALANGDLVGLGMQIGRLMQSLQTSECKSKACVLTLGALGVLQVELPDFLRCKSTLEASWYNFQRALKPGYQGKFSPSQLASLAKGVAQLANAVQDCGVPSLTQSLETTADLLGNAAAAKTIGSVVAVLVEGADVTEELDKLAHDFGAGRWSGVGAGLAHLASLLSQPGCKTTACHIAEGVLDVTGGVFSNLLSCVNDFKLAEDAFVAGAQSFSENDYEDAVKKWGNGLNVVAKSVSECGSSALKFIEQEANVLGFANSSASLGSYGSIVIHGADFYQELYTALTNVHDHDWRAAGHSMGTVLKDLSKWTGKFACTSDACYLVIGVLQFLNDVQGSIKACEHDMASVWMSFEAAYNSFDAHDHSIFNWRKNKDAIKTGVKELGVGFKMMAQAVGNCHLQEFERLLSRLATKLEIAPQVSFFAELLHIFIQGVDIEREVHDACQAYADENWVGFGYNLAQLVRTLL